MELAFDEGGRNKLRSNYVCLREETQAGCIGK